jgi:hypothetical protein
MILSQRIGLFLSLGVMIVLQGCYLYVPDLDGTYIPHSAIIHTDKKTAVDILKSFQQAEGALKRKDLDSLMDFYADNYTHRGFTKDSLKAEWKHLFQEYRDFSATHVLTHFEVVVDADRVPLTAQVTCTGSLWAISNDSHQRVNIDSWYNEVHYLAYVAGAWRIQGHAWEIVNPKDTPTARPPHPFF